jgi:hypothetical protein
MFYVNSKRRRHVSETARSQADEAWVAAHLRSLYQIDYRDGAIEIRSGDDQVLLHIPCTPGEAEFVAVHVMHRAREARGRYVRYQAPPPRPPVETPPTWQDQQRPASDEIWRHLIWWFHNPEHRRALYGDDGELQCQACMIDFKRMPAEEIEARLMWGPHVRAPRRPPEETP